MGHYHKNTSVTPANTAACVFEALVAAVRLHPENVHAEVHAVNLVAILAALPGRRACVALVHPKNFSRYQHFERVLYLLEGYGVSLERHWHKSQPAFFLFVQLEDDEGPAGAALLPPDHDPEPELELGVAA